MTVSLKVVGVESRTSGCNQLLIQGVRDRETQKVTATITNGYRHAIRVKVVFKVNGDVLSLVGAKEGGAELTSGPFTVPANGSCEACVHATARDEGTSPVVATVVDESTGAVHCEAETPLTVASDIVIHAPDGGIYVIPGQLWAQTTPLSTTPATGEVTQLQIHRTREPMYKAVYDSVAGAIAEGKTNVLVTAPPERQASTVACFILNLAAYHASAERNP
jgi:hypothetical protein